MSDPFLSSPVLQAGDFVDTSEMHKGSPGGSDGKESAYNAEDLGSIPGSETFPGERNDDPLQYPRLENSMDRGAWQDRVLGFTKSQTSLGE